MSKWIITVFLLPALFGAGMIFMYRDVVFYWDFAQPVGREVVEPDAQLLALSDSFLESRNPGMTCATDWFARDEKYLYLYAVCGLFERVSDKEAKMVSGWMDPVRLEWDLEARQIREMQLPEEGPNEAKSFRALFPKLAYAIARQGREPREKRLSLQALIRQEEKTSP
jgi:hypothetical protein